MKLAAVVMAASLLVALPAQADQLAQAAPAKSPAPGGLGIKGVTVDVQPKSRADGSPAGATHVETPPFGGMRGYRIMPSATPSIPPRR